MLIRQFIGLSLIQERDEAQHEIRAESNSKEKRSSHSGGV